MPSLTATDMESRTMAKKGWVKKGHLTAKARQRMPKSDFALPGNGEGPKGAGAGSYPIPDANHARNALARVAQHGTPAEKAAVRRKVHEKFPNIGKDKKKRSPLYDHQRSMAH